MEAAAGVARLGHLNNQLVHHCAEEGSIPGGRVNEGVGQAEASFWHALGELVHQVQHQRIPRLISLPRPSHSAWRPSSSSSIGERVPAASGQEVDDAAQ